MKNYLQLFLLPATDAELTRSGVLLYLTGLLCTFGFFAQFGILSIDMLKPQAIVIGLYAWLWAVALPRILILLTGLLKWRNVWVNFILAAFSFAAADLGLFLLSGADQPVFKSGISLLLQVIYYTNIGERKITAEPAPIRNYLMIPLLSYLFAVTLLPLIPQAVGGAMPGKVFVTFKDPKNDLLASRFVKSNGSYDFLYETASEYYFLEKREDSGTGIILSYVVKRISKSEVIKLEFHTSLWSNF
ncbi:MAG: hypothetical protein JWQ79_3176 [Mucilaginibacter sp.]|nr:hypothetical protein [Mucilaginibacter sp.]